MRKWYILVNKYSEKLKELLHSKNNIKILVVIGMISAMLILLSEIVPSTDNDKSDKPTTTFSSEEYISTLEERTQNIISSIDGVGECKVMITAKESSESVYAKNVDEQSRQGYYSENNEYVLYESEEGETPVLIKQFYPNIQGVVVVCDGGDNVEVKEKIIFCITSLFDIPSSHISVSKIKQKR